jgi:hypothetical protein
MPEIINGWEYLLDLNPLQLPEEQKIQQLYVKEYNLAYQKFIAELCLTEEQLKDIKIQNTNNNKYLIFIDTTDNNILNVNSDYPIKFEKNKFIIYKNKKIKNDLITYYKPLGIFVKGPFELINNKLSKYYIELYWHIKFDSETLITNIPLNKFNINN